MISTGITLVKLALASLNLIQRFIQYLDEKKMLDDAARALWIDGTRIVHEKNMASEAARQRVRDDLARNPDDVRAPDSDERKD